MQRQLNAVFNPRDGDSCIDTRVVLLHRLLEGQLDVQGMGAVRLLTPCYIYSRVHPSDDRHVHLRFSKCRLREHALWTFVTDLLPIRDSGVSLDENCTGPKRPVRLCSPS